ncbi:hypothetical protein HNP32_003467 [Brevundimonas bullata]|uniref:Uncharacterized protein n=1 Tax=Brevundimonas bullata TaxID=13160 RepID=A0A7W7IT25_9CAUL|nr:hypothetical protein [Brevundimonas bullata]MBB4799707.1 hypothetical protein [Brevundimonas bullata]MBB6384671.1 hypothetical protein [Brevundimonas bullata]
MTAPTTRETADHAELARIEALLREHIKVDASGLSPAVVRHFVFGFDTAASALLSEIAALRGEVDRLRTAVSKSNEEICQSLGKALGYPWFKDDQANFPGSTETDGVCVGDHVAESIADEAARRLTQAERQRDELRKALEPFARAAEKLDGLWSEDDWRWNDSVRSGVTVRDIRLARQALANQGADQ